MILPPPKPRPSWSRDLGVGSWLKPGLEVFAGSARLKSFITAGLLGDMD